MEETETRLSEELLEVCRDYCSILWAHALDAAGVPADSTLRLPEKVFFPPEIREIPDGAPEASGQTLVIPDAIPLLDKAKEGLGADSQAKEVTPQLKQEENPLAKA